MTPSDAECSGMVSRDQGFALGADRAALAVVSVSVGPGATAFTVMPVEASSSTRMGLDFQAQPWPRHRACVRVCRGWSDW